MSLIYGVACGRSDVSAAALLETLELGYGSARVQRINSRSGLRFGVGVAGWSDSAEEDRGCNGYAHDEDQRIHLVADARLCDRERLLLDLGVERFLWDEFSDAQAILAAYSKWGSDCVVHLVGRFAFAVYCESTEEFFVARDHCGEASLFYSYEGGVFAFASLPHALFPLPGVGRKLNLEELARFIVLGDGASGASQYVGVRDLLAGSCLAVKGSEVVLRDYWDPTGGGALRSGGSPAGHAEELRELARLAVSERLRGCGKVGAFLSGGLDSAFFGGLAAEHLASRGETLYGYTYIPTGDYHPEWFPRNFTNERPYVEDLAKGHANVETSFVDVEDRSFFTRLSENLTIAGMSSYSYYNRLWMEKIAEEASGRGVGTLLEPQTGNVTFSYKAEACLSELASRGEFLKLVRFARRYAACSGISTAKTVLRLGLLPHLPPKVVAALWKGSRVASLGNPFVRRSFLADFGIDDFDLRDLQGKADEDAAWRLKLLRIVFKRKALVHAAWRKMYGVVVQDPAMDKRLVEFNLSLPLQSLLPGGEPRGMARAAALGVIPDSIRLNYRKGIQLADWHLLFRRDFKRVTEMFELLLKREDVSAIIDGDEVRRTLKHFDSERESVGKYMIRICVHLTQALALSLFVSDINSDY